MNGYSIVSARYANEDRTAIELVTSEFGAVMVSAERKDLWKHASEWIAAGGQVAPHVAPEPEEKRDVLAELDQLKAALVRKNVVSDIDLEIAVDATLEAVRG